MKTNIVIHTLITVYSFVTLLLIDIRNPSSHCDKVKIPTLITMTKTLTVVTEDPEL